jgi:GTP cyclohydrolase IA
MPSNTGLRVIHDKAAPRSGRGRASGRAVHTGAGHILRYREHAGYPGRMARAYAELFTPRPFDPTTFPNDECYDELVLARSIPVRSVCEHHLLPWVGVGHVGYLPGERILGLSKLARVVEYFACRPQVQERLTKQVADWLAGHLHAKGVGVIIEAKHSCMTLRGVHAAGSTTVTSSMLGTLREDPRSRADIFALTRVHP